MQQWQIQVGLGTLPVQLVCLSDASVAFVKSQPFKTIVDNNAMFSEDGFTIGKDDYQYNTKIWYKEIPSVLEWLVAQKLESPTFN
jgi:hypothetical protein